MPGLPKLTFGDYTSGVLPATIRRRVLHEHEAAHAVVARVGEAAIRVVTLESTPYGADTSLGSVSWTPRDNDVATLVAGVVAGPAQTRLCLRRMGVDLGRMDQEVRTEAIPLADAIGPVGGVEALQAAEYLIRRNFERVVDYLCLFEVQKAVRTVADEFEACEARGLLVIPWTQLEGVVDWRALPTLPSIDAVVPSPTSPRGPS